MTKTRRTAPGPRGAWVIAAVAALVLAGGWTMARAETESAGSLDVAFDGDGVVVEDRFKGLGAEVSAQTIIVDGGEEVRYLVLGRAVLDPDGTYPQQFAVARYRADGTLDTSFGANGIAEIDLGTDGGFATDLAIDADGNLVVVGAAIDVSYVVSGKGRKAVEREVLDHRIAVVRLDANGNRDRSFGGGDGVVLTSTPDTDSEAAAAVAILPDGDILVGGSGTFTIEISDGSSRKKNGGTRRISAAGAILARYDAQDGYALDGDFGGGDGIAIDTQFVIGDGYILGTGVVDMAVQASSHRVVTLTTGFHEMIRGYDLSTGALDVGASGFGFGGSGWYEATDLDDYSALAIAGDESILVCGERRDVANTQGGDGVVTRFQAGGAAILGTAIVEDLGPDATYLNAIVVDGGSVVVGGLAYGTETRAAFAAWFDAPLNAPPSEAQVTFGFASETYAAPLVNVGGVALSGSDVVISGDVRDASGSPAWFLARFLGI